MATVLTPERILTAIKKIVQTSTGEYRKKLDENIHVVDVSFNALKMSDPKLDMLTYNKIITELEKEFKVSNDLKDVMGRVKGKDVIRGYAAIVDDPKYGTYIVAKKYDAVQTRIARALKRSEHGSLFTGTDETGKTVVNIGHTPSNRVSAAVSPLSSKISTLIKKIPSSLANPIISELNNLYNTHSFDTEYSFNRPDFDFRGFDKIIGSSVILVTIHTASKNNEFSKEEAAITARISAYINSSEFEDTLLNTKGSNSIKEDIEELVSNVILGVHKSASKHSKKNPVRVSNKSVGKGKVEAHKLPSLRSKDTGRFTSLISLQALIQAQIGEQIARNMGDGNRKDILNFRTGRFASSVTIEGISRSRQDALSVYYNYMKYPYQTFEPGWAQGHVPSRNPKLLISKSIREIGAKLVTNRMRAVLV